MPRALSRIGTGDAEANAGMVIAGCPEYYSSQVNPTHARERFRDALDLIVKAWNTPGPFLWHSNHSFFLSVNPLPRPLQPPHPK